MIPLPKAAIVQVRVLYTEGCPHTPATVARIGEVAHKSAIPIELKTTLISTQEEAEAQRLIGSPTVQVNGVDLDPDMRDKSTFGFT